MAQQVYAVSLFCPPGPKGLLIVRGSVALYLLKTSITLRFPIKLRMAPPLRSFYAHPLDKDTSFNSNVKII